MVGRVPGSEVRGFADDIELDSEIVSSLFAALEAIVLLPCVGQYC